MWGNPWEFESPPRHIGDKEFSGRAGESLHTHSSMLRGSKVMRQFKHMDFRNHHALERYSFLWSEARLLVAAVALLLGGVPPIAYILGGSAYAGVVGLLLKLAWLASGVAAVYLLYRWYVSGMKIFGQNNRKDTLAFGVMVLSGINLGLVGLVGTNIGMSIASSRPVFIIVAVVYLFSAYYLYRRWRAHGERLFG